VESQLFFDRGDTSRTNFFALIFLAFYLHPTPPHPHTTTTPHPHHAKRPQFLGVFFPPFPLFLFYTKQNKGLNTPQNFKILNFFNTKICPNQHTKTPKTHPKK